MAMMKIFSLIVVFSIFCWGANLHASEQELHALVIGNSDYSKAQRLENARNDARAIAKKLRLLGFQVMERHDQSRSAMRDSLRKFHTRLKSAENAVALLFYAGHGIQRRGENFLIPVDADISKGYEIEDAALNLGMILSSLGDAQPRLSIVMLDACRNNPYERRIRGVSRGLDLKGEGLAAVDSVQGMILSYATEPGNVAVDGYADHSPYTTAILKYIDTPNLSIQDMLNQVGLAVVSATHGEQKPWVSSSPAPRFCFAGCATDSRVQLASTVPVVPFETASGDTAIAAIQAAFQMQSIASIRQYVRLTAEQEKRVSDLIEIYPVITLQPTQVSRSSVLSGKGKTLDMVVSEAINEEGNRVVPSPKWNHLTLELR
jgi:hypothetical protein